MKSKSNKSNSIKDMGTRKLVITVEDRGMCLATKVEGSGFSNLEILGILEEVKTDVLAKSKKASGMPASLAALLGAMGGNGGGDEGPDGLPPFLRNRPSDDED